MAIESFASLDEPLEPAGEVEAAWADEIERRAQRVEAGVASGKPWSVVLQELGARLAKK